jgi:hypothetical protein
MVAFYRWPFIQTGCNNDTFHLQCYEIYNVGRTASADRSTLNVENP